MKWIKKQYEAHREVFSYLFWGVMATVVSWGSYAIFVKYCHMSITVGNALSWVCAATFAFFSNKIRVFQSKSWKLPVVIREFGLFMSGRVVTGLFEIVAVPGLVALGLNATVFGVEGAWAKAICSVVVVILNYIFSKLLVFKNKGQQADTEDKKK